MLLSRLALPVLGSRTPTRLSINILTCLAAWTLPAPSPFTPACSHNVSAKLLIGHFLPPAFKFHFDNAVTAAGAGGRGRDIVSTFFFFFPPPPPPRVDITSKTWPSFADMLLRRWREGEHLGRVFFCAPLSHLGVGRRKRRRKVRTAAGGAARVRRCSGSSATFGLRRCL